MFDSVDVPAEAPMYTLEPLVSALDDRVPPTVTASTLAGYFVGKALEATEAGDSEGAVAAGEGKTVDTEEPVYEDEDGDSPVAVILREGVHEPDGAYRGEGARRVRVGVTARGRAGMEVLVVGSDAPLFYGPNREE